MVLHALTTLVTMPKICDNEAFMTASSLFQGGD